MYFMKYCICCYLTPGFVEGMPSFSWYVFIQFGCQRLYRDYCFSPKHIIHVVFNEYKVYAFIMFIVISDVYMPKYKIWSKYTWYIYYIYVYIYFFLKYTYSHSFEAENIVRMKFYLNLKCFPLKILPTCNAIYLKIWKCINLFIFFRSYFQSFKAGNCVMMRFKLF